MLPFKPGVANVRIDYVYCRRNGNEERLAVYTTETDISNLLGHFNTTQFVACQTEHDNRVQARTPDITELINADPIRNPI